ncbi:MAG: DUF3726 domain-containing protein [Boseongicola sp.]
MTETGQDSRRTLSEISSTCQKAARGAGCLWGLAEEAGTAARILESAGLPGSECVAAILTSDRACPCTGEAQGPTCGINAAASLSDKIDEIPSEGTMEIGNIIGPLLLAAPLVMAARRTGKSFRLSIDGYDLRIGGDGIEGDFAKINLRAASNSVSVELSEPPQRPAPFTPNSRVISNQTQKLLEAFAQKTLVPETEHSRASGAGPDA